MRLRSCCWFSQNSQNARGSNGTAGDFVSGSNSVNGLSREMEGRKHLPGTGFCSLTVWYRFYLERGLLNKDVCWLLLNELQLVISIVWKHGPLDSGLFTRRTGLRFHISPQQMVHMCSHGWACRHKQPCAQSISVKGESWGFVLNTVLRCHMADGQVQTQCLESHLTEDGDTSPN